MPPLPHRVVRGAPQEHQGWPSTLPGVPELVLALAQREGLALMWYMILLPLVLTGSERIEPAAAFMDLDECNLEAKKYNTGRRMLFLIDRYVCRHATAPILRPTKYARYRR
jgi:hypothetical protein